MLLRVVAVSFVMFAVATANAADKPAGNITGVYLTTRYPSLTVRAGETTTIDLSLHNFNHPPQELALSVPEVAKGWKATILGGGQPVESAIVAPDTEEKLQLRLEPPAGTGPGEYRFLVEAKGEGSELKLPIAVTVGQELPFAETLPRDGYVVHVDAVGEVPARNIIYRERMQTPSMLQVAVGP